MFRPVLRQAGGLPAGSFPSIDQVDYNEPIGSSIATKRYQTNLDGQDDFWLRSSSNYGATVNATLESVFVGVAGSAATKYLVGRHSNDRFYIANNTSGVMFWGDGAAASASGVPIIGELNHATLTADGVNVIGMLNGVEVYNQPQSWSGVLDDVGFGVKGDQLIDFFEGGVQSFRVATDTEDDTYKLSGNALYELPIGVELEGEMILGDPAASNSVISLVNSFFEVRATAVGASGEYTVTTVIGTGYTLTCEYKVGTAAGNQEIMVNGVSVKFLPRVDGRVEVLFTALSTTSVISFGFGLDGDFTSTSFWKSFSVKELPASALTFENGEVDGSDRELITRKADNSGWEGVASLWPGILSGFSRSTRIKSIITSAGISVVKANTDTGEFWIREGEFSSLGGVIVSCQAKSGSSDFVILRGSGNDFAVFNLSSGTIEHSIGSVVASISSAGDGFFLCQIVLSGAIDFPSIAMSDGGPTLSVSMIDDESILIKSPLIMPIYDYAAGAIT